MAVHGMVYGYGFIGESNFESFLKRIESLNVSLFKFSE
jgi:hypothetical protein